MSRRAPFAAIGTFFDLLGSAAAVSAAVENRRHPQAADLKRLGIDPERFRSVIAR